MDSAKEFQREVASKNFENAKNKVIKVLQSAEFKIENDICLLASGKVA